MSRRIKRGDEVIEPLPGDEVVAFLTDAELSAIENLADIYNQMCRIVGHERTREGDMSEVVLYIHALQNLLLSQAAARAYPGLFRLLGERVRKDGS